MTDIVLLPLLGLEDEDEELEEDPDGAIPIRPLELPVWLPVDSITVPPFMALLMVPVE